MISRTKEAEGWRYSLGPGSGDSAEHRSGWLAATVGSYGGSAASMMYLLWTPKVHGPDDTSTCKYRKAVTGPDGRPRLFERIEDAMAARPAPRRRILLRVKRNKR